MSDDETIRNIFTRIIDETCGSVAEIKTDVAVIKNDIKYIKKGQADRKSDKRDNQKWYLGIVSFVFFAYIAIKEITNG
ncbi:MAG: hypothetical protein IIC11_11460 [Proteobacteria bacterium]|nr:hypothetical protein [Pseudomonadota bacterium]